MKVVVGTMYTYVDYENDTLLRERVQDIMHHEMGVRVDGAFYSRAYKAGVWDGITDFYDMKNDKFHTGLLPQFLEGLRKLQQKDPYLKYELNDIRPAQLVHPDSIEDEIELGNGDGPPIKMIKGDWERGYQYEAVRRVFEEQVGVINVATNGGKCIPPFVAIQTSEGYMTLGEFFEKAGHTPENKEKVVPYTGDLKLVNRYGKLEKPSHLTFNGTRRVIEIRGHRGTKNAVTLNHPLLTVSREGDFQWKKAEDIQVGDFLVGRIGDNIYGNNTLVDEEESYALGAIVADGYVGQAGSITLVSGLEEVSDRVESYLLSLTNKDKLYHDKHQKNATRISLNDYKAVKEWHDRLGIKYGVAKDKHVPQAIMEAPKNIQLSFLSGYLESECSINNQKGCIDVTSASYTLINQVNLMLRNMGYVPTVCKKKVKGYEQNDYYVLALGCPDSITLLGELQFISESRKKQLEKFYEAVSKRKRNNKKEQVPFGKELALTYRESYKKEDIPKGFRNKFTIPNSISKTRLRELIEEYDKGDPTLRETLMMLVNEKYVFEEVVEINDLGEEPTFDVHMPETHSFIAEGIINHNTEIASAVIQQVLPHLKRGERVAFFTDSREIFNQSAERVAKRLGMRPNQVGMIGDGKFKVKNKQVVFVMVPTLISALKDPKQGVKFTPKESVIKHIAEQVAPKFKNTSNTRQLLRNYIKNCKLTTKVWKSAEEQLMYIAYDNKFTDKSAKMQLNKYIVEYEKILEKKNKSKFKRYKDAADFMKSVKVMIGDEIHHAKADTWFTTLSMCENADIRVGLTGTVDKKDKMGWQRLQAIFSQIIIKISNEYLIERGISSTPTIRLVPIQEPRNIELVDNFMEAYKLGIVENDVRNENIAKLALGYSKRKPGGILISVKEIDHGERIKELLEEEGADVDFIHGSSTEEHRAGTLEKFSKGGLNILIASTIIDEGVDMKSIGCMILAAGGKSMRQQLQRIGRGLRLNGIDGNSVMVFDFYDMTNIYLKRHSDERIKIFKNENFDVKRLGE